MKEKNRERYSNIILYEGSIVGKAHTPFSSEKQSSRNLTFAYSFIRHFENGASRLFTIRPSYVTNQNNFKSSDLRTYFFVLNKKIKINPYF